MIRREFCRDFIIVSLEHDGDFCVIQVRNTRLPQVCMSFSVADTVLLTSVRAAIRHGEPTGDAAELWHLAKWLEHEYGGCVGEKFLADLRRTSGVDPTKPSPTPDHFPSLPTNHV